MAKVRVLARHTRRAILQGTQFEAETPLRLPFKYLISPVAQMLKDGHDRARPKIETILAKRTQSIRLRENGHFAICLRTEVGQLELSVGNDDILTRMTFEDDRVYMLDREVVLRGAVLSETMRQALVGKPLGEIVRLPNDYLVAVPVLRVRSLTTTTRILLDLPPVKLFLKDIPESSALLASDNEALASCA